MLNSNTALLLVIGLVFLSCEEPLNITGSDSANNDNSIAISKSPNSPIIILVPKDWRLICDLGPINHLKDPESLLRQDQLWEDINEKTGTVEIEFDDPTFKDPTPKDLESTPSDGIREWK